MIDLALDFKAHVAIASVAFVTFSACSLEGLGPLPSTSTSSSGGGGSTTMTMTTASTTSSSSMSTTTSSSATTSTSSNVGGAGGAGGAPVVRGWPDSPTAFCSEGGGAGVSCASASPQDGTSTKLAATSYEVGVGVVIDHVTGLTWLRTPSATAVAESNASAECQKHNANQVGGISNWRLPTMLELTSLLDSGAPPSGPAIDGAFGAPDPNVWKASFWTATALATQPTKAYYVNFDDGSVSLDAGVNSKHVTCVAGTLPARVFTAANGGLTVIDEVTGLMWQKAPGGKRTWPLAGQDCASVGIGGHTNWRLPTYKELLTLVDESKTGEPVLRPELDWPPATGWGMWSSTPRPKQPNQAWLVAAGGTTFADLQTKNYYWVRCVRSLASP